MKGDINELSFSREEIAVMSGDFLLMESTLLPGTSIVVDGRTNNPFFLQRNFSRQYDTRWGRDGNVTTFDLMEDRLDKCDLLGSDFLQAASERSDGR